MFNSRSAAAGLVVALLAAEGIAAVSGLVSYDGFANGPRKDLDGSEGGIGWANAWYGQASDLLASISTDGLTYPDLPTAPGSAMVEAGQTWDQYARYYRTLDSYDAPDGRVFVSFLFRPDHNYASFGGIQFNSYPHTIFAGSPMGYYLYGLMIGDGLMYVSNVPEVEGEVAFLVLEFQKTADPPKTTIAMYVNPDPEKEQPRYADVDVTLSRWQFLPTYVELFTDGGVTYDEIRVGKSWRDVVPLVARGDADCSGTVDFGDIDPFVAALSDPGSVCSFANCDIDADGSVNFDDIDPFVECLINGGCP